MRLLEKMLGEKAIAAYGRVPNVVKAIEECAELQQALCKWLVAPGEAGYVENVHEELADVKIMINRMMLIFDPTEVEDWKESKLEMLARLLERGEEETGNKE